MVFFSGRSVQSLWVSPFDVLFMSGNVREWVEQPDIHYLKKQIPFDNSGILFKPVRGGSYRTKTPKRLTVTCRSFHHPLGKNLSIGFRCVKDAEKKM